ncbi:hypothetical protein [Planomicrobium sp. YIM 101495]|uniref:hypothetical protein n=1 Tax=Planomicrobium sp. YIM 101495 TaxID=2665160 RepID=UPI0012B98012|nr:hypothetical protein [Planomicrobium sp. YIM 101495]MTD30191.1 hypothetical protein [Planomicrobium sp. YIM 101495]
MTELKGETKPELVSTITGNWYKFERSPQVDLLLDLPNKMILGVSTSISSIECYIPGSDDVYYYAGDLNFKQTETSYSVDFHGRSIESLSFNNEKIQVPSGSDALSDVRIGLDVEKSINWFKNSKF